MTFPNSEHNSSGNGDGQHQRFATKISQRLIQVKFCLGEGSAAKMNAEGECVGGDIFPPFLLGEGHAAMKRAQQGEQERSIVCHRFGEGEHVVLICLDEPEVGRSVKPLRQDFPAGVVGLAQRLCLRTTRGGSGRGLSQQSEEETLARRPPRKETTDGSCAVCYVADNAPFFFQRNLDGLGAEFPANSFDLVFVFGAIEGAGAIDHEASFSQRGPHIANNLPLACGTLLDRRGRPVLNRTFVFSEHALAGAGHVGGNDVKESCQRLKGRSKRRSAHRGGTSPFQ